MAWDQHPRGYEAVLLAATVTWKQLIVMKTFGCKLRHAAVDAGLTPRPENLGELLEAWKSPSQ